MFIMSKNGVYYVVNIIFAWNCIKMQICVNIYLWLSCKVPYLEMFKNTLTYAIRQLSHRYGRRLFYVRCVRVCAIK